MGVELIALFDSLVSDVRVVSSDGPVHYGVAGRVHTAPFRLDCDSYQLLYQSVQGTNDQFIFGYGLFHDTWAPVATLAITVAVALAGGYLWGLPGVLLGDIASSITVISIWKPYFLYKEGFKMSVKSYWKNIFRYLLLAVLSWGLTDAVLCFLPLAEPSRGYGMWIVYALVSSLVFLLILCSSFYCCSAGMRSLVKRLRRK